MSPSALDPTQLPRRGHALVALVGLTLLFAARVLAQLVQRVDPRDWLPPFEAFQGSGLPYPALLAAQGAILLAMVAIIVRIARARWQVPTGVRRAVFAFGCLYFGLMAARLSIGAVVPHVGHWFAAWIPAAFHLVLATFVLTWASCLRTDAAPIRRGAAS